MHAPYQQLPTPHVAAYQVAAPSSSSSGCCPCCVEPGCCSRVGACPCFCTGYTAGFGLSLSFMWLAIPMLACAVAIPDLFDVELYGENTVSLGMWQACGVLFNDWQCGTYSSSQLDQAFNGAGAQFNALRILAVAGTAFALIAAVLAAIRLARLQRSKSGSSCLSGLTLLSALLATGSTGTAFGLSFPLQSSLDGALGARTEGMSNTEYGLSWIFLFVGVGLITVGTALHLLTQCCYSCHSQRAAEGEEGEGEAAYVAGSYPAASIFAHPQPLHVAAVTTPAVYYPSAAAIHYQPPPQYVQQPPAGHIFQ